VEAGENWNQDPDGHYIGFGDIQCAARDMFKFGHLYLNVGITLLISIILLDKDLIRISNTPMA
jgi:hypothetical protein